MQRGLLLPELAEGAIITSVAPCTFLAFSASVRASAAMGVTAPVERPWVFFSNCLVQTIAVFISRSKVTIRTVSTELDLTRAGFELAYSHGLTRLYYGDDQLTDGHNDLGFRPLTHAAVGQMIGRCAFQALAIRFAAW